VGTIKVPCSNNIIIFKMHKKNQALLDLNVSFFDDIILNTYYSLQTLQILMNLKNEFRLRGLHPR
jgi:hypothetical protein